MKNIAKFLAAALSDDLSEGGENCLNLTQVHHSDYGDENVVSIETIDGRRFFIVINRGWVG